ncbi:MAG: hypothetical protein R2862_07885 [Thermoanaerobaculia bacterium]
MPAGSEQHRDLTAEVERLLAGKGEAMGEGACDVLRSGPLVAVFGDGAASASFRPGSKYVPHPLCLVSWDKPDHDALVAARSAYERDKAMARVQKKPFDRAQPPSDHFEASLTILKQTYRSAAEAVADLESSVAQLEAGITVTVSGKEHTTQLDFDDLSNEVGDRCAWAPKHRELLVAWGGVRFTVSVRGFDDPAQDRAHAVELARAIGAAL